VTFNKGSFRIICIWYIINASWSAKVFGQEMISYKC